MTTALAVALAIAVALLVVQSVRLHELHVIAGRTESRRESKEQGRRSARTFNALQEHGLVAGSVGAVDCFIYAPTGSSARNLLADEYFLRMVANAEVTPPTEAEGRWSIEGVSVEMTLDRATLAAWSQAMASVATLHEAEFDGWWMALPT